MSLRAISDLHVAFEDDRAYVRGLRPRSPDDWLLVAGDVGERLADIEWALGVLAERFATVVWVRFRAAVVGYGHLHIPRTTWYDGVRFEELSAGYPRGWQPRGGPLAPVEILLDGGG